MIIYYNPDGTLYSYETNAGAPSLPQASIVIDDIYANRDVIANIIGYFPTADRSRFRVISGNLTFDGVIQTIVADVDRQQLKSDYLNAITQLESIQNAVNPTNAQVISAVKFNSKTIEEVLKVLKEILT